MIEALREIWRFAGAERNNINKSVVLCFLNAVVHMAEIAAIYVVVLALLGGETGGKTALAALGLVVFSAVGSGVINYFSRLQQTHAGYFMAANKRIDIANRLKGVPMGYFNESSLGELTGVATTVLENVETIAPMVLVGVMSGLINALVFLLMVLCWDRRIGLLVLAGTVLYLLITSRMEQKSRAVAPHRQKSEAVLVGAVLEYVQGMSVIKSFNLAGKGDKTVQDALEYNRKSNHDMEKLFTPYVIAQGLVLQIFGIAMILVAVLCFAGGTMSAADALMAVIMSFLVFAQIQSAGSSLSLVRIVSSAIEHAQRMDHIPQLDENGAPPCSRFPRDCL